MLYPVPSSRVRIADRFWAPRLEANRRATLPLIYERLVDTGRVEALRLNWKPGQPNPPHPFWESDLAKWMEAASYSLQTEPDEELSHRLAQLVDLFARAQDPDGYLNAYFTCVEPGRRWANLRDKHELYCAGHLIEAAVAHVCATAQTALLAVARRFADHLCAHFGPGPGQSRGYCGHPEIELALIRLFRCTGEKRYLELSRHFIEQRGQSPHYFDQEALARGEDPKSYWAGTHEYTQSHLPVRQQTRAVGHAVRALYLYSAMADLARETGDSSLLETCLRLWESVYQRQLYVTGGVGASRVNEGFTADYDLPNESAYAETCAAIASVFWNHRLLQMTGEGRFADEMERALYNGVLSGVSLDGRSFFYVNPLTFDPAKIQPDDPYCQPERATWFRCACCPPNIARLFASLGQYAYSENPTTAAVHLYIQGGAEIQVGGQRLRLSQETDYPWKGRVFLSLELERPATFELRLRLPTWCQEGELLLNQQALPAEAEKGYIRIERPWHPGDRVELRLPMPVQRVYSHPRVLANLGRVALQRGPLVYCVEGLDCSQALETLVLPRQANLLAIDERHLLGGIVSLQGDGLSIATPARSTSLYGFQPPRPATLGFKAIPYCVWANRGPAPMRVWLREL